MAGNLKRIEQTAKALLDELIDLGDRFNDAYDLYFQALAPAVQKQLIVAAYQICTRGYPEQFLRLSVAERASTQTKLQQLSREIQERFEHYFESDEYEVESPHASGDAESSDTSDSSELSGISESCAVTEASPLEDGAPSFTSSEKPESPEHSDDRDPTPSDGRDSTATQSNQTLANISTWRIEDLTSAKLRRLLRDHLGSAAEGNPPSSLPGAETFAQPQNEGSGDGMPKPWPQNLRENLGEQEARLMALALAAKLRSDTDGDEADGEDEVATPNNLRSWQRAIEGDLVRMLHDASVRANQLLYQCSILPQEFPLGVLEALGQGEAIAELPTGMPNLLKLTIKLGHGGEEEEAIGETLQLLAINLRLPEVEFADTAVSQARHTIRQLVAELSGLRKRYDRNQREYTIAKAEAAWRSTWCEE